MFRPKYTLWSQHETTLFNEILLNNNFEASLLSLHNPVARAARALAGRYCVASRQGARSASHRVM